MYTDRFKPRRSIERRYTAAIIRIMKGLRERLWGVSSPFQMLDVIRGFARSPTLDRAAREAASAMATSLFHDGERNWRAAAMKDSKERKLYPPTDGGEGAEKGNRCNHCGIFQAHQVHNLRGFPFLALNKNSRMIFENDLISGSLVPVRACR